MQKCPCKILIANGLGVKIFKTKGFGLPTLRRDLFGATSDGPYWDEQLVEVKVGRHNGRCGNLPRFVEIFPGLLRQGESREAANNLYRFDADGNHLADQPKDVLRLIGAVGVVGDAAALVG